MPGIPIRIGIHEPDTIKYVNIHAGFVKKGEMMSSIHVRYAVIGLGASLVLFLLLEFQTSWWWYWNWLIAASIVSFVMYGIDKTQAKREGGRVPNAILHLMALVGGFVGALFGRIIFNHKSNIRSNPLFLVSLILGFVISGAFIFWRLFLAGS